MNTEKMTKSRITKIVTFCCTDKIHVYRADSNRYPAYPFRNHKSIKEAIKSINDRGIKKPKVVES